MSDSAFVTRLGEQIGHEFSASQQYIAIAVYFDGQTLPMTQRRTSYQQSLERAKSRHDARAVPSRLRRSAVFRSPGIAAPQTEFADAATAVGLALSPGTTRHGSVQRAHASGTRRENAFQGEQFLQWFLKEQLEETSSMSDLLAIVERAGESNLLLVEEFLSRNPVGDGGGGDPSAPQAAGGAI